MSIRNNPRLGARPRRNTMLQENPRNVKGISKHLTSFDPDKRQRAENWRFAIGLQRADGLSVSPFPVELARKNIEGLMTNEEVQRAVRAHYSKQPNSRTL